MIIRGELIQRSKAKIRSTREWRDDNKIPSSKEGRESLCHRSKLVTKLAATTVPIQLIWQ